MSRDLAELLGPQETIVLETRQHWFVVVRRVLLLALGAAALDVLAWLTSRADWLDNTGGDWLRIALLVLAGGLLLVAAWRVLDWWTERLYVTTSKIVYAHGILDRDVTSTPLVKVDEVTLCRPLIGRMLGFGRLDVENAAGGSEPLAGLEYLPKPVELYRIVTERSRNQRMVEGGAHRDDDNDGLVDPARTPSAPDEDGWRPTGDSTTGR